MTEQRSFQSSTYRRFAVLLICIGIIYGTDTLLNFSIVDKLWPLIISILAIGFIGIYFKRDSQDTVYISVGAYLLQFSVLALLCNFTSWTLIYKLWPLFIGFLGVAFIVDFFFNKQRRVLLFLGLVLTSLCLYFILLASIGAQFWWTILLLLGISILIAGRPGAAHE